MDIKLIWKIENFSCLKSESLQSTEFHGFFIMINPCFSSDDINIQIKRTDPTNTRGFSNWSIALLDSEGSPLLWRQQKNVPKSQVIQFNDIKRDTIFGSMRSKFLPKDTLRVQCLRWDTREYLLNPEISCFMCSRVELDAMVIEKTFRLHIANISYLLKNQTGKNIELVAHEGEAKILTKSGDEITVRLFLDTSLIMKLSVFLVKPRRVQCIISTLDAKGKTTQFVNEEYDFQRVNSVCTVNVPVTEEMLALYRNKYAPNDMLRLVFAFTFSSCKITHCELAREEEIFVENPHPKVALPLTSAPDEPEQKQEFLSKSTISRALMGILKEGFMSDFSFRVQDKTFPVHKNILSARSSVFRAMFTVDMKEKESSSVDVPEMEADTFKRMLDFIYSDSVEDGMQWESASKLYSVSDKYALEPLKQKCSRMLKTGLCVSNFVDVLLLGDTHQDDDLKYAVLDFVARNDKEIVDTELWGRFAKVHPLLALDTLQRLYVKKMNC